MGIYGPGTPLSVSGERVWRGVDKTNGFLMRSADGRVPAIKESFARVDIGAGSVLADAGTVPYGNALWRNIENMETESGVVCTTKPTVGIFVGVAEFNQGWQSGHPVQGWGVPAYGRADMIRMGLIGYKVFMAPGADPAEYLAYLQGDMNFDDDTVRLVYSDVMALYASGADGDKLAVFFSNDDGFPVIDLYSPAVIVDTLGGTDTATVSNIPVMADHTFGGFIEIFEPENQAVFMSLKI